MLIRSPKAGQLNPYPADSDCRWLFIADNSTELDIIVREMYLETCSYCSCDYVQIYKGIKDTGTKLYKFCKKPNQEFLVRGGMVLHFHSDSGTEAAGFKINVSAWKGICCF